MYMISGVCWVHHTVIDAAITIYSIALVLEH